MENQSIKTVTQLPDPVGEPNYPPSWWIFIFLTPLFLIPFLLTRKKPKPLLVVPTINPTSRMILTPFNCLYAYAYWEIPDHRKRELREQGGQKLAIRLYNVTSGSRSAVFETFEVKGNEQGLHLSIRVDNLLYEAELGYLTSQGRWLMVAKSEPVKVPPCPLEPSKH